MPSCKKKSNSLWENDLSCFYSFYHLCKQFTHEFMTSITSFNSSSVQHDVHLSNYGPIYSKREVKAGNALGWGYLMTNEWLPQNIHRFSVRSNQFSPQLHPLLKIWSLLASKLRNSRLQSGWLPCVSALFTDKKAKKMRKGHQWNLLWCQNVVSTILTCRRNAQKLKHIYIVWLLKKKCLQKMKGHTLGRRSMEKKKWFEKFPFMTPARSAIVVSSVLFGMDRPRLTELAALPNVTSHFENKPVVNLLSEVCSFVFLGHFFIRSHTTWICWVAVCSCGFNTTVL